jgi:hypothetical protein
MVVRYNPYCNTRPSRDHSQNCKEVAKPTTERTTSEENEESDCADDYRPIFWRDSLHLLHVLPSGSLDDLDL